MNNLSKKTQTTTTTKANISSGATTAESLQLQQRLWVKEQETTALKVQNRHLIAKLEEAVKSAEPNQINTSQVATEIQKQLRPLIAEIEKSLTDSFDLLKSTMRGIYQQSQRAQQAVEEMSAHARESETRMSEQRKADQVYYQEKILSQVTTFGERIERQLENRLRNLAVVELMNTKQNEVLADIEQLKGAMSSLIVSNEGLRSEIKSLRSAQAIDVLQELRNQKFDVIQESMNSETILRQAFEQRAAEDQEITNQLLKEVSPPHKVILDHL